MGSTKTHKNTDTGVQYYKLKDPKNLPQLYPNPCVPFGTVYEDFNPNPSGLVHFSSASSELMLPKIPMQNKLFTLKVTGYTLYRHYRL